VWGGAQRVIARWPSIVATAIALVGLGAVSAHAGTLTTLATVPGQILDATPSKVLYQPATGPLEIRDVAAGTDETVPLPTDAPSREVDSGYAKLIPGGAMYASIVHGDVQSGRLEEWRTGDAAPTDLGGVGGAASLRVAGIYAVWIKNTFVPNPGGGGGTIDRELIRRDLTAGTNQSVAPNASGALVLANGDVYYSDVSSQQIFKWHNGVATQITHGGAGDNSSGPLTDGTAIAFVRSNQQQGTASVFFSDGSTSESMLPGSTNGLGFVNPGQDYAVAGNWVAYERSNRADVWTRAPDGTLTRVSTDGATALSTGILGLGSTGQVMYGRDGVAGGSTFLGAPGAHPFPVGPPAFQAFRASDGHWYVVHAGSLARLEVGTAITARPAAVTQSHAAHFELASTELQPTYACTLDGAPTPCTDSTDLAPVADGAHAFTARTTSPAADPTGATATWTVDSTPPEGFALGAPEAGAALSDAQPALSWQAAADPGSGVASYRVTIDGQTAGTTDAATTTFTPSTPLADGEHPWQVRAVDAAGNARDSETRTFTVDTDAPSAPEPGHPGFDEAVPSARPTFTWSPATDAGSGVAGYDVEVDGVDTRVGGTATSFTATADLPDGEHSWRVAAIDRAGNRRGLPALRFRVDTRPPLARVVAGRNPTLTGQSVQFDASGSSPAAAAITDYAWDLDGNGTFETDTGGAPTAERSYATPGDRDVSVRVTDAAGRSSTAPVRLSVTPAPLPGPPGVSIDDAAQFTSDSHVTLTLRWPAFATQMLISNDGGFAGAQPVPVAAEVPWQLASSGPDRLPKTVYVRFIGGLAGNETYTDDVILDETAPQVASATMRRATGARAAAAARRYAIDLRAADRGSGLAALQIAPAHGPTGPLLPYRRSVVVSSRTRPLSVRVIDRAGNRSRWKRLAVRR
jgi:hypothetical protein